MVGIGLRVFALSVCCYLNGFTTIRYLFLLTLSLFSQEEELRSERIGDEPLEEGGAIKGGMFVGVRILWDFAGLGCFLW